MGFMSKAQLPWLRWLWDAMGRWQLGHDLILLILLAQLQDFQ
jgi:hypothetical protein